MTFAGFLISPGKPSLYRGEWPETEMKLVSGQMIATSQGLEEIDQRSAGACQTKEDNEGPDLEF